MLYTTFIYTDSTATNNHQFIRFFRHSGVATTNTAPTSVTYRFCTFTNYTYQNI